MEFSHHKIGPEQLALMREFEEMRLTTGLRAAATRPSNLSVQLQTTLRCAGCVSATDSDMGVLCRALRQGARVGSSVFELAAAQADITVDLGELQLVLPPTGPTSGTHAGNWKVALWLALIVRDKAAIASLQQTECALIRRSSSKSDELQYMYVEALQAFMRSDLQWRESLRRAEDEVGSAAERRWINRPFAVDITAPELELLRHVAAHDTSGFNRALVGALTHHRAYWSGSKANDPAGFLAFGPLALAALAWDAGIPVDVRSHYLPTDLYRGSCAVG